MAKYKVNILLVSLFSGLALSSYAEESQPCTFYAKFNKVNNKYEVESASSEYINEENVLITELKYDNSTNKIELGNLRVPYKETPSTIKAPCRSIGENSYPPVCGGYFVSKDVAGTAVKKPVMWVITLGIGAVVDLANGSIYDTNADQEQIDNAKESSDILTSRYSEPYINSCKLFYSNVEKQKAEQKRNEEIAAAKQKQIEENQRNIYKKWLASMSKFRAQLKPSSLTNCGTVIETKSSMVHVQTGSDAGNVWLPSSSIYSVQDSQGKYVGCHDSNRWYKRYGNWVNNNNTYTQSGISYNDDM